MYSTPTRLGYIEDVKGATVSVSLEADTIAGLVFIDGEGYRIGQIGSFVRIPMGYLDLFGVVTQVGAGAVPERLANVEVHGRRWITVQLVGEGQRNGQFKRGLSQYPTVGDEVHLLTLADLHRVYGRPGSPNFVRIGHLASAPAIPALIDLDSLVNKHAAVVGTTGSGKSTTVAGLLHSMADSSRFPSARILVLDIHGEYASAFGDLATVFRINPRPSERRLAIPYWALTFDEFIQVSLGSLEETRRGAIMDKIMDLKRQSISLYPRRGVDADSLTVDSPVPFSVHKLWFDMYRYEIGTHSTNGGQSDETEALLLRDNGEPVEVGDPMRVLAPRYRPHTSGGPDRIFLSSRGSNLRKPLEGLASRLRDPRYDFLFRPAEWLPDLDGMVHEDLDTLLTGWIGSSTPVTVLDLSGVPGSVLTVLAGVLLRLIYDALFWARNVSEGGRERPLFVVLEEAHVYLNQESNSPAAAAVRRVVKEGRKYGIGALLVSQRPAEIDTTILSQCGTVFAMRLSNPTDRSHVVGTLPDHMEGLLSMLPTLRTGEAIVIGEAVHLPMRTLVERPPEGRRPDSSDPPVADSWSRSRERSDYSDVVAMWREQQPRSSRFVQGIQRVPVVDRGQDNNE